MNNFILGSLKNKDVKDNIHKVVIGGMQKIFEDFYSQQESSNSSLVYDTPSVKKDDKQSKSELDLSEIENSSLIESDHKLTYSNVDVSVKGIESELQDTGLYDSILERFSELDKREYQIYDNLQNINNESSINNSKKKVSFASENDIINYNLSEEEKNLKKENWDQIKTMIHLNLRGANLEKTLDYLENLLDYETDINDKEGILIIEEDDDKEGILIVEEGDDKEGILILDEGKNNNKKIRMERAEKIKEKCATQECQKVHSILNKNLKYSPKNQEF